MPQIAHLPSRIITLNGEEYRYFSGTSYLGMGHNEDFRAKLLDGISLYGTSYGSSRNNLLQLSIYQEAENFLAQWTTAEAALTCSSGLLAGQIVSHFVENGGDKTFFFAPKTHPANWNSRYSLSDIRYQEWAKNIVSWVEATENEEVVIVSNSLDAFACEEQRFDFIQYLPENKKITLILDDSHGIGVTGENGAGIFAQITCPENVKLIVVASMNKALGIPAGVILSDKATIEAIQQSPFWIGASPAVPAYLYAFVHAQAAYTQAREHLQHNIQFFTEKIKGIDGLDFLPNYPVFKSKDNNLYKKLIAKHIMPYHFLYPSQSNEAVTRLIISSLHTEKDLLNLAEVC